MHRTRYDTTLLLVLSCLTCVAVAAAGFLLVSDGEFARDQAARQVIADGGRTAGEIFDQQIWTRSVDAPAIEIVTPNAATPVESPVDIFVRFAPGPGAAIAPETLRIRYGVIGLDVTERIRKAATVTPEGIRARGAQLPAGEHAMSIEIADTAGRKTKQKFKFRVTN
jgi:hypothetical protein